MQDNVAIVTGGGQGIGRVIAEHLLRAGCHVALWEADPEAAEETAADLNRPDDLLALTCDVSSEADVKNALDRTLKAFGRLDFLVNNAGISDFKPLDELTLADWNRVIGVNLTGAFLCAKHAAPHLRETGGAIVNIASTRAFQSEPDAEAYAATKGGLVALTHALAVSLGPMVRVNCVSPGWIDVSGLKKRSARQPEKLRRRDHAQHPAGRVGQADDVARMVLFLLDEANSFVTGQNFFVDGGMTRKMIYEE
jgi:NAD(P)-dependent dehydrogenase (short-subunit alcohol dehydrogenase family)